MARDKRGYGLNQDDRDWVIKSKFGAHSKTKINMVLQKAHSQSDKILGAILFLARSDRLDDLLGCVKLANENEKELLNAATVKDERS